MKLAGELIDMERNRQREKHGYVPEVDARYEAWELHRAAEAFLLAARGELAWAHSTWPWRNAPPNFSGSEVSLLAKAGAMIVARLEVIMRVSEDQSASRENTVAAEPVPAMISRQPAVQVMLDPRALRQAAHDVRRRRCPVCAWPLSSMDTSSRSCLKCGWEVAIKV